MDNTSKNKPLPKNKTRKRCPKGSRWNTTQEKCLPHIIKKAKATTTDSNCSKNYEPTTTQQIERMNELKEQVTKRKLKTKDLRNMVSDLIGEERGIHKNQILGARMIDELIRLIICLENNKNTEPESQPQPQPEPQPEDIDAIAAAISGLLLALYKQSTNEKSDMEEEVYGDIVEEEEKVIDDHLHKLCKNTFYETFKQPSRIEGMPYKTPIYVSHDNEYCYGTLISKEIVEDKYIDKSVEQLKCPFNKPYTVGSNKEEYKIDGEECSITKPKKEKEKPIVKPKESDEEETRESREIITKQNKGKKSKQTKEQG